MLKVRKTKKYGRGVYADRKYKKGEIVEVSPVIIIPKSEAHHIQATKLKLYVFGWNDCRGEAVALGFGSLFNHKPWFGGARLHECANVTYSENERCQSLIFRARRTLKKGEQLFIDYGYDPTRAEVSWRTSQELKTVPLEEQNEENKIRGGVESALNCNMADHPGTVSTSVGEDAPSLEQSSGT